MISAPNRATTTEKVRTCSTSTLVAVAETPPAIFQFGLFGSVRPSSPARGAARKQLCNTSKHHLAAVHQGKVGTPTAKGIEREFLRINFVTGFVLNRVIKPTSRNLIGTSQ
jgi:hypothetical protein